MTGDLRKYFEQLQEAIQVVATKGKLLKSGRSLGSCLEELGVEVIDIHRRKLVQPVQMGPHLRLPNFSRRVRVSVA